MNRIPHRLGSGCAASANWRRQPRARAKAIAVWREKLARERDLPRAWILSDAALFSIAQANPAHGRRARRRAADE